MAEFTLRNWDVLVVDDEPDILFLLEYILNLYDANVVCASSGQAALDIMRQRKIHMALFDIIMPKVTGWDLVKAVRTSTNLNVRTMPLVAVTAMAMPGDAERLLDAGFDAYLAKPIDAEVFAATIRALVLNERDELNPTEAARAGAFGQATLAMADQLRRVLNQSHQLSAADAPTEELDFEIADLFDRNAETPIMRPPMPVSKPKVNTVDGGDPRFARERSSAEMREPRTVTPEYEGIDTRPERTTQPMPLIPEAPPVPSSPPPRERGIRGFFRRYRHRD